MKNRLARLWYRFKNWFRTKPGPGEPLRFLCGSEEELRRVTTWICHFHAHIFQFDKTASVVYKTKDDFGEGRGGLGLPPNVFDTDDGKDILSATRRWFALVFRYNEFVGTIWLARAYDNLRVRPSEPGYRRGLPTWFGIVEYGHHLFIKVQPPSARERTEAFLALSEWLDGKVSEQEKRELLHLPDAIEI